MHEPVCRFWAKVMHSCPSSLCQFSVHDFPEAFYNCCFNEVSNFREKSEHRVVVAHAFNTTGGSLSWRSPGQPEKHCLKQTKKPKERVAKQILGKGEYLYKNPNYCFFLRIPSSLVPPSSLEPVRYCWLCSLPCLFRNILI